MDKVIWVLWDIAAVAILLSCVSRAASRGLVRTVVSFAAYVMSAAVANLGSPVLAQILYDYIVRDSMRLMIAGRIDDFLAGQGATISGFLEALPSGFLRIMGDSGQQAAGMLEATEAGDLADQVIDVALREPVLSILQGLSFLILFSLMLALARYASRLFTGVYRIPVIGTLNTFLGGVLGVLQGVLTLYIAAFIIHLVIVLTGGGFGWLNHRVMDDTYIWRVFYNFAVT